MFFIDRSNSAIPAQQRAFLSTLWVFVLLNVLVRDVHQFFAQGFLEQAMLGKIVGQPTSELALLAVGVLMQIPLLMVVLPRLLPDQALRVVNTLAAFLTLLMTGAQVTIGPSDADDLLFAAVKAIALMVILRATRPQSVTSAALRNRMSRNRVSQASIALAMVPFLALLSLAVATSASAQQRGHLEVGLGIAALELDDKLGGDTGLGMEGRLGYFVTDRFQLEIQHSSASAILDGSFQATTLNGLFYFAGAQGGFSPYGLLGVGRAEVRLDDVFGLDGFDDMTDDTVAFRAALGARIGLGTNDRTSLRLEVTALREEAFGDDTTHLGLSSTFSWHLGGRGR